MGGDRASMETVKPTVKSVTLETNGDSVDLNTRETDGGGKLENKFNDFRSGRKITGRRDKGGRQRGEVEGGGIKRQRNSYRTTNSLETPVLTEHCD